MKAIMICWNEQTGVTTVRHSQEFKSLNWIDRADCLKDALYELESSYNKTLEEFGK